MTDTREAEEFLRRIVDGRPPAPHIKPYLRTVLATIGRLREEQSLLRELLAICCGDGGHYDQKHGTAKAVKYGIERYSSAFARAEQAEAENGRLREAATFWRGTYATLKERSIHKDEDGAFWCLVCDMADKHASDCPLRDGFGPNAGKGGEDDA